MKYIGQFGIILVISFVGEILNYFIPLPVPASIYGLVIMFLCLHFGIIRVGTVKGTADFLIEIMPLMFIPAAVELMTLWHGDKTESDRIQRDNRGIDFRSNDNLRACDSVRSASGEKGSRGAGSSRRKRIRFPQGMSDING